MQRRVALHVARIHVGARFEQQLGRLWVPAFACVVCVCLCVCLCVCVCVCVSMCVSLCVFFIDARLFSGEV